MSNEIVAEVGKTYEVDHSRKGRFVMQIAAQDDTWTTGVITSGRSGAMLDYNVYDEGDEITVRTTHCTFTEVAA